MIKHCLYRVNLVPDHYDSGITLAMFQTFDVARTFAFFCVVKVQIECPDGSIIPV